ncbi:MAG: M48 family metallopeptidase, partial [Brachybacterium tyrofermentans]
ADRTRPAGSAGQFGRFPGADYSARPATRDLQLAAPQLSGRTGYVIPAGPYRDDARAVPHPAASDSQDWMGGQPPQD